MSNPVATNANTESEEIATRIMWEVNRVAIQRRTEWLASVHENHGVGTLTSK
jgi:hypothetical protein